MNSHEQNNNAYKDNDNSWRKRHLKKLKTLILKEKMNNEP